MTITRFSIHPTHVVLCPLPVPQDGLPQRATVPHLRNLVTELETCISDALVGSVTLSTNRVVQKLVGNGPLEIKGKTQRNTLFYRTAEIF